MSLKAIPTFVDWNTSAAWAVHATWGLFWSFHMTLSNSTIWWCRFRRCRISSTMSYSKMLFSTSSDLTLSYCVVFNIYGNICVPICKNIGNFFFNSIFWHEVDEILKNDFSHCNWGFPNLQMLFYYFWSQGPSFVCYEASKSSHVFAKVIFCFINRA